MQSFFSTGQVIPVRTVSRREGQEPKITGILQLKVVAFSLDYDKPTVLCVQEGIDSVHADRVFHVVQFNKDADKSFYESIQSFSHAEVDKAKLIFFPTIDSFLRA